MHHVSTIEAAKGKWRGILAELGVPEGLLSGKHQKCPFCTSRDNFRFDNRDGSGSWICTCGAGTGMQFAIQFLGQDFRALAPRIDTILGNVKQDAPGRRSMDDGERRAMLQSTWRGAQPLQEGDLVTRYLSSRRLAAETSELRFHPALKDGDGGVRPAMVARLLTPDGARVATLHRTFLRPDGLAKAEMDAPRKLMPGDIPPGSAVRLGPVKPALGIAEGIETALAASILFELPVWAVVGTALMKSWTPPEGVEEVLICADHDDKFGGQAAAYATAHRLKCKGLEVNVKLPERAGEDWNDVLMKSEGVR